MGNLPVATLLAGAVVAVAVLSGLVWYVWCGHWTP
jgi:hypothetical protein